MLSYTVKKGDTLSAIAQKYNTSVSAIQQANKTLIKDVNKISVGWVLNIPTNTTATTSDVKTALNKCLDKIESLAEFKELLKLL